MENEDEVQSNGTKTLLIRHLPAELSQEEKEDFLKYFGAKSVKVFPSWGRLKHAAFASFKSKRMAAKALSRLHQLEVLNQTLVVEFAKGQDDVVALTDPPVSDSHVKEERKIKESKQPNIPLIETGVAPEQGEEPQVHRGAPDNSKAAAFSVGWKVEFVSTSPLSDKRFIKHFLTHCPVQIFMTGNQAWNFCPLLKFQSNPTLKYLYPSPSNSILTNITHALLSVPKFYVQVLHLMNKMNLPCPFGPVTARPPQLIPLPPAPAIPMPPPFPPDYPPLPEEEMELSSGEESEYESGDDEDKERIARLMGLVNQACKRPLRPKAASKRKKPKIKDLLYAPKPDSQSAPVLQPSDVFEQPNPAGPKKIEFHISVQDVAAAVEGSGPGQPQDEDKTAERVEAPGSGQDATVAEGFGKLYPSSQTSQQQEEAQSDDEQGVVSDVVSRKELEKGRLSKDEIKRMSVFKNYEAGEPTCRLYVKNIAKQVEEKDLRYIYERYINPSSEAERNMFDIVLMKEGRMKGQAFIGLPSEQSAEKALRETNGFVLHDKPLVVQFARSARPKQDTTDQKKGPKQR